MAARPVNSRRQPDPLRPVLAALIGAVLGLIGGLAVTGWPIWGRVVIGLTCGAVFGVRRWVR